MLHKHMITSIDDALNAVLDENGSYSGVETTRMEKDEDLAGEIRAGRIAPLHPEVEAMRPIEHMRARSLLAHTFYTVIAYRKNDQGQDIGVTTAIVAPGAPGRDVTAMTREEVANAVRRQFQPLLDTPITPIIEW